MVDLGAPSSFLFVHEEWIQGFSSQIVEDGILKAVNRTIFECNISASSLSLHGVKSSSLTLPSLSTDCRLWTPASDSTEETKASHSNVVVCEWIYGEGCTPRGVVVCAQVSSPRPREEAVTFSTSVDSICELVSSGKVEEKVPFSIHSDILSSASATLHRRANITLDESPDDSSSEEDSCVDGEVITRSLKVVWPPPYPYTPLSLSQRLCIEDDRTEDDDVVIIGDNDLSEDTGFDLDVFHELDPSLPEPDLGEKEEEDPGAGDSTSSSNVSDSEGAAVEEEEETDVVTYTAIGASLFVGLAIIICVVLAKARAHRRRVHNASLVTNIPERDEEKKGKKIQPLEEIQPSPPFSLPTSSTAASGEGSLRWEGVSKSVSPVTSLPSSHGHGAHMGPPSTTAGVPPRRQKRHSLSPGYSMSPGSESGLRQSVGPYPSPDRSTRGPIPMMEETTVAATFGARAELWETMQRRKHIQQHALGDSGSLHRGAGVAANPRRVPPLTRSLSHSHQIQRHHSVASASRRASASTPITSRRRATMAGPPPVPDFLGAVVDTVGASHLPHTLPLISTTSYLSSAAREAEGGPPSATSGSGWMPKNSIALFSTSPRDPMAMLAANVGEDDVSLPRSGSSTRIGGRGRGWGGSGSIGGLSVRSGSPAPIRHHSPSPSRSPRVRGAHRGPSRSPRVGGGGGDSPRPGRFPHHSPAAPSGTRDSSSPNAIDENRSHHSGQDSGLIGGCCVEDGLIGSAMAVGTLPPPPTLLTTRSSADLVIPSSPPLSSRSRSRTLSSNRFPPSLQLFSDLGRDVHDF